MPTQDSEFAMRSSRAPSRLPRSLTAKTIVDLKDTIRVLARLVADHYPTGALWASGLAKSWFVELARSLPRKETEPFETQEQVGTRVLTHLLRDRGIPAEPVEARRLLRRAWDEWQAPATAREGATKRARH